MQSSNAVGGYSDFFKSGFRAFTSCARGQVSSSHSYLSGSPDIILNTSPLTPKTTCFGATKRRPRPVSLIVQNTPREKARRRRSSFLSLSSQLFDRKSATTSLNEQSTISSPRSSTSSRAFDSGDSLPEVWITAGGSYTQSTLNESSNEAGFHCSIDPFCSSSDATSIFIDLQDDCVSDSLKHDSFLSLTSSSRSSVIMTTRRERPSSNQTITPNSSRQSSPQYHHSIGPDKFDFFRVIEEEVDVLHSSDVMEVDHEDWDAPAKTDWRQFHVDILTDDM